MRFRVIGPGRAGESFRRALIGKGWTCVEVLGRSSNHASAAADVDAVLVAVPDAAIGSVAKSVEPGSAALVHLSGVTGLDALVPHVRRASVHPLVSLPDGIVGAQRLSSGGTFAVAGDPIASQLVDALGGRALRVADERRAVYHAAAAVASNHLVALCAQVERLANQAQVPVEVYWEMMSRTLENVIDRGAAASLTGPAARGDHTTLARHLEAIGSEESALYRALCDAAADLGNQPRLDRSSEEPGNQARKLR